MSPPKRAPAKSRGSKPAKAKRTAAKQAKPSAAPRARSKTRALAVPDAVRSEPIGKWRPSYPAINPLAMLEPLRRQIADRQIALVSMALDWHPARILVSQQAAFWEGFAHAARTPEPTARKGRRKPVGKRTAAHGPKSTAH